jgi:hypothetical protein
MKNWNLFISAIFVGLAFNSIKSQSFFDSKDLSFTASYGYGKIQFFLEHTPTYIGAADQNAVEYSPSWNFELEKSYWINDRFNFSLGLSHITITEKTNQTAKPDWFDISEKNLSQGFIHLTPSLNIRLPDERFSVNLGIRIGTASFFGSNDARESSHSLGTLHADIDSEFGVSVLLSKRFYIDAEWINGLTKYDYMVAVPVSSVTYFKYHSFQFGIRFIIRHGKEVY